MAFYCQEERDLSCDSCYELTFEYCSDIVINPGIAPGYDPVYLQIIDQFNVRRTQEIEFNEESFTIDISVLPDDFFNPYSGKKELYISIDQEGLIPLPMIFNEETFNCLLISIVKTIQNTCC